MSVRTKLLAVILAVNGLLLGVVLFLYMGEQSVEVSNDSARTDLIQTAFDPDQGTATKVDRLLADLRASGQFAHIWLWEEPGSVWRFEDYFAKPRGAQIQGARRDRILWIAGTLVEEGRRVFSDREGLLAVRPSERRTSRGQQRVEYMVVAASAPPPSPRTVYFVVMGGTLLMSVLLYWLLTRWVMRPLTEMATAAQHMAEGDFHVRVEPRPGLDELARTTTAFNRMAEEISEYQGHLEDRVLTALSRVKKAEQHLTIAQRLASSGKLAAGLAHEINNPVGGMKNALRGLARGDLEPEKTKLYLELIEDGLTRVESTVKTFLSFTPRSPQPERTDLRGVAERSAALAAHRLEQRGASLALSLPEPREAMVFGDPGELQQVVLNLLLNAADAVEAGAGQVTLAVRAEETIVEVRVSDNGSGMSPEAQQQCFDMFFTTKEVGEGTGMGLAVVHNIVSNHGGRIDVSSREGEGTTFRVVLPADPGEAPPDEDS